MGGFEAVIWTNVLQGLVLWASVLVMLGYLLVTAHGGPARLLADAQHKMQGDAWPAGFTLPGLPALVLCGYGSCRSTRRIRAWYSDICRQRAIVGR